MTRLTHCRHYPSGTPATRMPSMWRSRQPRKVGLSLRALVASRKRRMVKLGSSATPACAAARASRSRQIKMHEGSVSVCVNAPAHPDDGFRIGTELLLGEADHCHPSVGIGVARRKAQCLVDVSFALCAST